MLRVIGKPVDVIVTGESHPDSSGTEVIWVGVLDKFTRNRTAIAEIECSGDWHLLTEVSGGEDYGTFTSAFRGDSGKAALKMAGDCEFVFVSHPWSGVVEIRIGDRTPITADLYSETTKVVTVDTQGFVRPLDPRYVDSAAFLSAISDTPISTPTTIKAEAGVLKVRPLGISAPAAQDCEVIILEIQPFGLGIPTDLKRLGRVQGWEQRDNVFSLGGNDYQTPIVSRSEDLVVQCDATARITLLKHAWSGLAEISLHDTTVVIDLYSENDEVVEFTLTDLREYAAKSQAKGKAKETRLHLSDTMHESTEVKSRTELYRQLTEGIDPHKPVAIYVPRWRGVALSTETLFEQSIPVPPTLPEHPDDITDEDILFYARMLLETGSRHFVISGGDTFNLKIAEKTFEMDPQVRFDLLWHSNYLQMGEHHDWNLLRHWLQAASEGKITRIGVVKEGMENWFRSVGLDSVFIPNVVPFDTETIKATTVQDCVGIWLSGSTHYRKMPHAAIAAVGMLPDVYLRAAGLDKSAMQMISAARTPFRKLRSTTLPREQLHREMQETGLTLYVTLSECSPMLPLESFSLGVPCLVGPASNLFREDAYLADRLIVDQPLSPSAIAEKAKDALQNQAALVDRYKLYYADTLARAREGVEALLA